MKSLWLSGAILLGLAWGLMACGIAPEIPGPGEPPPCETIVPPETPRAIIFPTAAGLRPGETRDFAVQGGPGGGGSSLLDLRADWSVDGGGTFGTITPGPSTAATYRAPATVLTSFSTTVRARLVPPNNTICATATVTVTP